MTYLTMPNKSTSQIILFGGFRSSGIRYNDVWTLDVTNDEWSQPHAGTP